MRGMGVLAALGLLLASFSLAIGIHSLAGGRGLAYGMAILASAGLGLVYLWLFLRNTRLIVSPESLGYQNWLGRRRLWGRDAVSRIVALSLVSSNVSAPRRGVYFFDRDGRRLLALNPRAWSQSAIDNFVAATGHPVEYRAAPITLQDAKREFPGIASNFAGWIASHGTLSGYLLVGILAVAIAATLIALQRSH